MPLHEYLCESCGRTFEAIQGFAEPALTICDRCGGPLKKLISAPAVQFKGSGWYVSDYGKSSGSSAKRESGEGSSETKSSDAKTSDDKKSSGASEAKKSEGGDSKKTSESKKPDAA